MLTLNEIIFKYNSDFQNLFHFFKSPDVNDSLEKSINMPVRKRVGK